MRSCLSSSGGAAVSNMLPPVWSWPSRGTPPVSADDPAVGQGEEGSALLCPAAARRRAVERQSAVAALVVGRAPERACLHRAAPATVDHRGGVAGPEAVLAHRALPPEVQRASSARLLRPDRARPAALAVPVHVALAVARLGVGAAAAAEADVARLDRPGLLPGGVVEVGLDRGRRAAETIG